MNDLFAVITDRPKRVQIGSTVYELKSHEATVVAREVAGYLVSEGHVEYVEKYVPAEENEE